MTPTQFKRLRVKLFRSQPKAAKALGVTQQAVSHWELGSRPIPETVEILLEFYSGKRKVVSAADVKPFEGTVSGVLLYTTDGFKNLADECQRTSDEMLSALKENWLKQK